MVQWFPFDMVCYGLHIALTVWVWKTVKWFRDKTTELSLTASNIDSWNNSVGQLKSYWYYLYSSEFTSTCACGLNQFSTYTNTWSPGRRLGGGGVEPGGGLTRKCIMCLLVSQLVSCKVDLDDSLPYADIQKSWNECCIIQFTWHVKCIFLY